ncbi:MAG: hypothetical protein HSCHL_1009 [Hydrogenibacillus schlegelii]|uniref:Uncharacterized protein n=1 Tax=Hydrogenibacillus schlegelii TaxID=1484 RepID=A0A2T5G6P2_HYDSH|nr:MAG: hypothetical protein HSCHL_1009 [Hydrogenibacillus schlegelii]
MGGGFEPTYEGLKLVIIRHLAKASGGFEPTYEGLKPGHLR